MYKTVTLTLHSAEPQVHQCFCVASLPYFTHFVTHLSKCSPWCGKSDDFCGFSLIFADPGLEKEVGKSKITLFLPLVFDLCFRAAQECI